MTLIKEYKLTQLQDREIGKRNGIPGMYQRLSDKNPTHISHG